jgi:putative ABC transport system permease protein
VFRIAWKNILHDRVRMLAALLGIVFAVVLVTFQFGLLASFLRNASSIVDHSGAPIWITAPSVANFEFAGILRESLYYQARAVPGVGRIERIVMTFVRFRKPNGSYEGAQLLGIDLENHSALPWEFAQGTREDLRDPEAISIDDTDYEKLGRPRIGEYVEINDRRARVVAVTHNARSFIASPFLFTSLENAYRYTDRMSDGATNYLLVTPAPGWAEQDVVTNLRRLIGVDILTASELGRRSQEYWIFSTGAGFAIGLSTVLGLVVGTVIVGQTIYSSTVDRLKEFGTLKAIGAGNRHLYLIITYQATLYAIVGYCLGVLSSVGVSRLAATAGTDILITPSLLGGMFFLTVLMCIAASFLSIVRVTKLEPAMVFK